MAVAIAALALAAVLLNWAVAAIVLRSRSTNPWAKTLASLLALEGLFQVAITAISLRADLEVLGSVAFAVPVGMLPFVYLMLLASLDTPLVSRLRSPHVRRRLALAAWIWGGVTTGIAVSGSMLEELPTPVLVVFPVALLLHVTVQLFALAAAVSAVRRTERGTPKRERATAYALAFGIRDVLAAAAAVTALLLVDREAPASAFSFQDVPDLLVSLSSVFFALLLGYGILRTQLFDLDLRVKWAVGRSALAGAFVAAFLIVDQMIQALAGQTLGAIAGAVAAGLLLFALRPLQRWADRVADRAMPDVRPTPGYVLFKKLEVYRSAVEAANETGGISGREHAALQRLCEKLGLAPEDAAAVQAEVLATHHQVMAEQ